MLPKDFKRHQREREIAEATRGPDYTLYNQDMARVKAEVARRKAARDTYKAFVNAGLRTLRERGEQGLYID